MTHSLPKKSRIKPSDEGHSPILEQADWLLKTAENLDDIERFRTLLRTPPEMIKTPEEI